MSTTKAWRRCRRNAGTSRNWLSTAAATDLSVIRADSRSRPAAISTRVAGLLCEVGRGRTALERAYPDKRFLWLDTEESSGEVFWLDADQLR